MQTQSGSVACIFKQKRPGNHRVSPVEETGGGTASFAALGTRCPQYPKVCPLLSLVPENSGATVSLGSSDHLCGCRRYLNDCDEGSKNPPTQGLRVFIDHLLASQVWFIYPKSLMTREAMGRLLLTLTSCRAGKTEPGKHVQASDSQQQHRQKTDQHFSTQAGKQRKAKFPLVFKMRRSEGPATPIWGQPRVKLMRCW